MPFELAALLLGAFAAAFVSGAVGFGNALVAAAIWLPFLEPHAAVPLIVITGLLMHGWALKALRAKPDFKRLTPFIAGGIIGAPLGTWLLTLAEPAPFRRAVGVILIAYGLVALLLQTRELRMDPPPAADAGVGLAAGVLGNFAGLAGLLPTMWCGLRGWTPDQQRAVYQPVQLALGAFALVGLVVAGLVDLEVMIRFGICLPPIALGLWSGYALYARLDPVMFRRAVTGLVLLSGLALVVPR
ncbi:MAG: sulfite exporter TauE/SafE family protein [Gammaproteobacteria bacterium]|nr:sulfite exporter TauE/SafE family protein [Gammaproteobacteria bacterium]